MPVFQIDASLECHPGRPTRALAKKVAATEESVIEILADPSMLSADDGSVEVHAIALNLSSKDATEPGDLGTIVVDMPGARRLAAQILGALHWIEKRNPGSDPELSVDPASAVQRPTTTGEA